MLSKLIQNPPFSICTEGPQHKSSYTGPATEIQIYLRQMLIIHQKRNPSNQKCISTSKETIRLFTSDFLATVYTTVLKMKTHTEEYLLSI